MEKWYSFDLHGGLFLAANGTVSGDRFDHMRFMFSPKTKVSELKAFFCNQDKYRGRYPASMLKVMNSTLNTSYKDDVTLEQMSPNQLTVIIRVKTQEEMVADLTAARR